MIGRDFTDWWLDRRAALERLHLTLEALLGECRENDAARAEAEGADGPNDFISRFSA